MSSLVMKSASKPSTTVIAGSSSSKPNRIGKEQLIIFSPILVILIGTITIRLAELVLGVWAWLPWILVYWASICFLVFWGGSRGAIRKWMRCPQGSWLWSALAILVVISSLFMFVNSWHLLKPVYVWLPWLIVGLVNPILEEWYWRGLLLDKTSMWPSWFSIFGTNIFFSLNHLFGIAVTSTGSRNPIFLINTYLLGVIFAVVYKKTNSLRWVIVAHAIADLLGLSVVVFLNLWVPPA